jgi:hypothetical protein
MKAPPIQQKESAGSQHESSSPEQEGKTLSPPAFQLMASDGGDAPPAQLKSSQGGLPGDMLNGFAASTGHDLSDVKVHTNSDKPSQVGALAYAQGNDIHLGAGQEKHLAHEAAHIVQQREGRVKPTTEVNGKPVNDNAGLESEADSMGAKAMQMKAEAGASLHREGKSLNQPAVQLKAVANGSVIQRLASAWGKFHPTISKTANGLDASLEFEPDEKKVDATKIAFSQSVRTSLAGTPRIIDPSQEDRMVSDGTSADGFRIDRLTTQDNPLYGTPSLGAGKKLEDTSGSNSKFDLGYCYDDKGTPKKKNAFMHDSPGHAAVNNSKMEFESAVLAIEGAQKDTYYGSIKWGWERDGSGTLKELTTEMASQGTPTNNFLAAAKEWNETTARGTVVTKANDTIAYKYSGGTFVEDFKEAANVQVQRVSSIATAKGEFQKSKILSGTNAGREAFFHVNDLKDKGDGDATIDLPLEDVHVLKSKVELNKDIPGPWADTGDLDAGTRVRIKDNTYAQGPFDPDFPYAWKVLVEVVDGVGTGRIGWVPAAALQDENPNI